MVTTDTTGRKRPGPGGGRGRQAHRLDPSPTHWIERERHRRPQRWCMRLQAADGSSARVAGRRTSLEWW